MCIRDSKYVARCDWFICPSFEEGFSTAATEALVVGTPVVTTLCSGMKEMLGENNEYGIIVENKMCIRDRHHRTRNCISE